MLNEVVHVAGKVDKFTLQTEDAILIPLSNVHYCMIPKAGLLHHLFFFFYTPVKIQGGSRKSRFQKCLTDRDIQNDWTLWVLSMYTY